MLALFRGHGGAHGTYGQEDRSHGRAKVEIKKTAKTLRDPPTAALWEKHLLGERALGIVPINEEGLCWWGVIDVDVYSITHADVVKNIKKFDLPIIVCRSKSGGAHLFVFLREPVLAAVLISKLNEVAAALGYGGSEIFPKQTEVKSDRGDVGNWLNMPYFRATDGDRYAVNERGNGMSLRTFLDIAERSRITLDELDRIFPRSVAQDEDLSDGPPCLQYLASVKVSEGGRNNALFAYGVLAKKKYPDSWESVLETWNQKFISPALTSEEVMIIKKSLKKKEYSYKCKDQPLCSHCDATTCKTRRHGVSTEATPDISSISVLDTHPPLFFVCLTSGGTVECGSDDILSSRAFQRAALEQLRTLLPLYKQDAWMNRVQKCLEQATVIEAPRESSTEGAFRELLQEFATDRFAAKEKDEILLGKPWQDEEGGRHYFRLTDLMAHLRRVQFRDMTRQQVTSSIRNMGGDATFFNLRGRGVNVFWVPSSHFEVQTEAHSVPRLEESPV